MEWKEKPAFGGCLIWVADVEGHWIASTAAVPQRGAMATADPGDHVIPAEFATEESAVKAAMNYIGRITLPSITLCAAVPLAMPRQRRLDAPDTLHHAMVRGVKRRIIVRDDADRTTFVTRVARLAEQGAWTVYAWALRPSHAHLLVRTGTRPVPGAFAAFSPATRGPSIGAITVLATFS